MKFNMMASATALTLILANGAAFAEDLTGVSDLDDRIADIETAVSDDLARSQDAARFGNPEFRPGLTGSASLGYSGQTGNSELQEFSAGARLRHATGNFVQSVGVAVNFADDAGVKTKEDLFAVYDANYYVNGNFYGFALGRVETDGILDTKDGFLGVGPGYRIINTEKVSWRVQAGVGQSYTSTGPVSTTEIGYIASSRIFFAFNENMFVTNDTDILYSDSALRANNDLGLSVKMTDSLSTRLSLLTEYDDSMAITTDNKIGVSLVFGF